MTNLIKAPAAQKTALIPSWQQIQNKQTEKNTTLKGKHKSDWFVW